MTSAERIDELGERVAKMERRMARAARYCRAMEDRVETLERLHEEQWGTVERVAAGVHIAGSALTSVASGS